MARTCCELSPEERAWKGIFLAFQYPVEIPGVSNMNFLRTALNEKRKANGEAELGGKDFLTLVRERAKLVEMDPDLMNRNLNVGFSGGEKKRNEIFQMAMLEPKLGILDETDSGLDIDALRIVSAGVNKLRASRQRLHRGDALPTPAGPHRAGRGTRDGRWQASSRADRRNWRWSWKRRGTIG